MDIFSTAKAEYFRSGMLRCNNRSAGVSRMILAAAFFPVCGGVHSGRFSEHPSEISGIPEAGFFRGLSHRHAGLGKKSFALFHPSLNDIIPHRHFSDLRKKVRQIVFVCKTRLGNRIECEIFPEIPLDKYCGGIDDPVHFNIRRNVMGRIDKPEHIHDERSENALRDLGVKQLPPLKLPDKLSEAGVQDAVHRHKEAAASDLSRNSPPAENGGGSLKKPKKFRKK